MKITHIALVALVAIMSASCSKPAEVTVKPRVIVTCDPELDDNNSLIRYLLFADGMDTEGIIYASSRFHWKGDGQGTTMYIPGREYARAGRDLGPQTHWRWAETERFIDNVVEAYEKDYPNLKVHNPNLPTPEYVKSIVRVGNVEFEGDISKETPGSELIKDVLLDDDMRPVFLQAWGGPSTIARALKSIQEQYEGTPEWEAVQAKVYAKARLGLSCGAQDESYQDYIVPNWPNMISLTRNAGAIALGYGAKRSVQDPADTLYYCPEWTSANILGKGAMSKLYRVWGDGQQMAPGDFTDYFGQSGKTSEQLIAEGYWVWSPPMPKGNFISEGDTPEYINLLGNGLRAYEDPTWGGWAGRYKEMPKTEGRGSMGGFGRAPKDDVIPDFVPAVQNNFAARMAWTATSDYSAANHEPVVTGPLSLSAEAGKTVKIAAKATDPDNNQLSCQWAQWKIDGAYQGDVQVSDASSAATTITIPADAKSGDTIHMILTVVDNGSIPMTSYLRTVITVK